MTTLIIILSIVLALIVLIYSAFVWGSGKSVIKSKRITGNDLIEADMIYYLPAAELLINATATVTITKTGSTATAELSQLTLTNSVSMIPDAEYLFGVHYKTNIFMNDEIRVTTGSSGLLDAVMTTTDDRLNSIIKTVVDAPGQMMKPGNFFINPTTVITAPGTPTVTTSALVVSKIFHIRPDQEASGSADCPWLITADIASDKPVKPVNAGFTIKFTRLNTTAPSVNVTTPPEKGGLYTRPLTMLKFAVTLNSPAAAPSTELKWEVLVPDTKRLVFIPVQRSSFVKRVNTPKFSSGLLIENYINMPSQFEGFISIPINIAKALVSIPAALFNFTIHHKYDQQLAELAMQKRLLDAQKMLKSGNGKNSGQQTPPHNQAS